MKNEDFIWKKWYSVVLITNAIYIIMFYLISTAYTA